MVEWNPGIATGLLFVLCLALAGWAALWLMEGWALERRMSRWTPWALLISIAVLLGCAAGLFLLQD